MPAAGEAEGVAEGGRGGHRDGEGEHALERPEQRLRRLADTVLAGGPQQRAARGRGEAGEEDGGADGDGGRGHGRSMAIS
jgi:hypothetical protein